MKNKKGVWGFWAALILVLLVVAVVSVIAFGSVGKSYKSLFGFFEPIKKYIGVDTKKDDKSSPKENECIVRRFYWSKNKAKINERVNIIVEGNGNCNDKIARIIVYESIPLWYDKILKEFEAKFKENVLNEYVITSKGTYYFVVKLNDYGSKPSEMLKSEQ